MSTVNEHIASRVAEQVERDGFSCTIEDVNAVAERGSVDPSVVGDEYDEALTEAIREQLDEYGVT